MRATVLAVSTALAMLSMPLHALDAGRADGKLVVNGTTIPLTYSYVVGRQKNQITSRTDDIKVILTDKPLLPDTNFREFDANFPEGVLGVVVCIDKDKLISHLVVQHPNGMYDAGYFTNLPDYRYRARRGEGGAFAGTVYVSRPVATATIQFTFDVDFSAQMQ
jgi:hypothetical protein